MSVTAQELNILAAKVLDLLERKELTLSGAESATGGLASAILTNIPGCSKHFIGSVVCYTAQAKNMLLDVDWDLINAYGTVSPEVIEAMLNGLNKVGADVSYAITGVAQSPLDGKPTGTVVIGINIMNDIHIKEFNFKGNRLEIKEQAVGKMYELLIAELERL